MADLKRVYVAVDEQTALSELDSFDEKWSSKYPKKSTSCSSSWLYIRQWQTLFHHLFKLFYIMSTEQMVLRNHLCETFGFTPKNSIRMPFLGSRH